MKTALRTRLLADGVIAGLVGTRIDWGLRPQGKPLPSIRLTRAGGVRHYTMAGASSTQFHRVQIDCFAATPKGAEELGDAVIACLEPASGSFQGSFVLNDDDRPERTEAGEVHNRMLEFQITYVSA